MRVEGISSIIRIQSSNGKIESIKNWDIEGEYDISIYKKIRAKTLTIVCAANRKLGITSYLGLLALSKHGLSFGRTTNSAFS